MSMGEINVNYQSVYSLIGTLKSNIDSNIAAEAEDEFTDVADSILQYADGASAAELFEAASCNKEKSREIVKVLHKLSDYIDNAAKALEELEAQIAQEISSGGG